MADAAKESKPVIVKCISAYRDSTKMRLIIPPMKLAVTKERADELVKANVCEVVKN